MRCFVQSLNGDWISLRQSLYRSTPLGSGKSIPWMLMLSLLFGVCLDSFLLQSSSLEISIVHPIQRNLFKLSESEQGTLSELEPLPHTLLLHVSRRFSRVFTPQFSEYCTITPVREFGFNSLSYIPSMLYGNASPDR